MSSDDYSSGKRDPRGSNPPMTTEAASRHSADIFSERTMTDKTLRAVPDVPADGAQTAPEAPVAKPLTLPAAVATGNYREILRAQQAEVAQLLDEGAGAQTAQLHRTLTALSRELKEYDELIGVTRRKRTPDEQFKGA